MTSHPEPPLDLIDKAISAAKTAAHRCTNETAKEHFEYALALLTESWVAENGQAARCAGEVIGEVRRASDLFELVFNREEGN